MLRTNTIDWVALVMQKAVTFMQTLPYIDWHSCLSTLLVMAQLLQ